MSGRAADGSTRSRAGSPGPRTRWARDSGWRSLRSPTRPGAMEPPDGWTPAADTATGAGSMSVATVVIPVENRALVSGIGRLIERARALPDVAEVLVVGRLSDSDRG